jgi:hypothetical protein
VGIALLLVYCVGILPRQLAPSRAPEDLAEVEELTAKDRIQLADDRRKLQNDVRTALLQAIVAGAVLVGVLFTWQQQQATSRDIARQLTVTRQGQVGERFSRAVGQLGNKSIDVRLGALYELEQLALQAPERRRVIIEVVASYIRQHARPPKSVTGLKTRVPPPQDVAAAFTIIGRRSIKTGDVQADLRKANLGRLDLERSSLVQVDFTGADLGDANLLAADLQHATFYAANLRHATLYRGKLQGANLTEANLFRTNFTEADLRDANLANALLVDAFLTAADLRKADLTNANLTGARVDTWTIRPRGFEWRGTGVEQED